MQNLQVNARCWRLVSTPGRMSNLNRHVFVYVCTFVGQTSCCAKWKWCRSRWYRYNCTARCCCHYGTLSPIGSVALKESYCTKWISSSSWMLESALQVATCSCFHSCWAVWWQHVQCGSQSRCCDETCCRNCCSALHKYLSWWLCCFGAATASLCLQLSSLKCLLCRRRT